jgi:hypothetical protein
MNAMSISMLSLVCDSTVTITGAVPASGAPGASGAPSDAAGAPTCRRALSARVPTACTRPRYDAEIVDETDGHDDAVWAQLEQMLAAREAAKALHPSSAR